MALFSSLEQIFTTIKTIFKIFIFCISTGPYGGMWNLQTPCTGGSSELISKCLSCMILYNYSSYFKIGEINSCRLSALPTFQGTDHDFCRSGKPIYHFQKQGDIHIFQNKLQNSHKFAEIMKKNRGFGKSHSWGHSDSVFNFLKLYFFFMCSISERKAK